MKVVLGAEGLLASQAVAAEFAARTWPPLHAAMPWLVGASIAGSAVLQIRSYHAIIMIKNMLFSSS